MTNWKPLEDAIGVRACCDYMAMGAVEQDGTTIYLYKHRDTRRYLNIDAAGAHYRLDRNLRYVPAGMAALEAQMHAAARAFPTDHVAEGST